MRIIGEFCVREILDEVVAIPVGNGTEHFSGIISLNPVGRFLFEVLYQEHSQEELVAALVAEYEVTPETAANDVEEFLNTLRANGLLDE